MPSYPSRRSPRLKHYDYSQSGAYFVTLCIEQRLPLLGSVNDAKMRLSPAGIMVARIWSDLGEHDPVEVDAFVVMPNHVHGILVLGEAAEGGRDVDGRNQGGQRRGSVPTRSTPVTDPAGPISLSTLIQRFKTMTVHEYGEGVAAEGWSRYPGRLWQHSFHDHVIRNERDLAAIRAYIAHNPLQWHLDRENPDLG